MKTLDSFHPFRDAPETANPALGCSAHYFEIEGAMLGAAWYGQGLRLLDISDARDVSQVGYYRVSGTGTDNPTSNSWDVAFRSVETKGKKGKKSRRTTCTCSTCRAASRCCASRTAASRRRAA